MNYDFRYNMHAYMWHSIYATPHHTHMHSYTDISGVYNIENATR